MSENIYYLTSVVFDRGIVEAMHCKSSYITNQFITKEGLKIISRDEDIHSSYDDALRRASVILRREIFVREQAIRYHKKGLRKLTA